MYVDIDDIKKCVHRVADVVVRHLLFARPPDRPVATILVGFELEYVDNCYMLCNEVKPIITSKFRWHRDYRYVYEMSGPPMPLQWPLPKQYVYYYSVMEMVANFRGFRVAEYKFEDDERTCGSHVHFSTVSSTLTAKMHDWLIVLSHHLIPVATLRTRVEEDDDGYGYVVDVYGPCYRIMVSHYCEKPMYVSKHVVEDAADSDDGWRGYEPEDGNAFYAVELNKYRKRELTVEFRLNEQHWLASLVIVDIARVMAKHRVPIINIERYYNKYVYACKQEWPPIDWQRYAYKTSDVDVLERLKTARDLYQFLLEEHERELLPVTREVAEKVLRKRLLTYKDYLEIERELAETVDCSDCLEVNEATRKLYECKVGY